MLVVRIAVRLGNGRLMRRHHGGMHRPLGAVVVDGRAYVLLGGSQPGLTVSDVIEVLDLR
jgi:hypothetical protein